MFVGGVWSLVLVCVEPMEVLTMVTTWSRMGRTRELKVLKLNY